MKRLHRSGLSGILGAIGVSLAFLVAVAFASMAHAQTQNFTPPPNTLAPPFVKAD
jgi:hypothetical protein